MIEYKQKDKTNKDCELCDTYDTGYACISCEGDQVKEKYPKAYLNDDCEWIIPYSIFCKLT